MKFEYTPLFPLTPYEKWRKIPWIDVTIIGPKDVRRAKALVDSGAEYNLINLEFADKIGIDLRNASRFDTFGVTGKDQKLPTYLAKLKMRIDGLGSYDLIAGFIESDSVSVILGQLDFFDQNKIIFEKYHNTFEIKRKN